jgi:glycosyltransferase involved in cell wall biosynthesis
MGISLSVGSDARDHAGSRPLRLLWLIDSLTMGGAESLAVAFASGSSSERIDLTLCARTTIGGNPLENELRSQGTPVQNLRARRLIDVAAFRRLLHLIRERQIDVIHAHLAYSSIWGALASRLTGVPLVATLHVGAPVERNAKESIRQFLLRLLLNRYAAKVIAVSAALRGDLVRGLGLHPDKVTVVHNGINLHSSARPEARLQLRQSLRIPGRSPLIVTVAVLRDGKGIDVLIRAAPSILEKLPEARFLMVGDGPMRGQWEKLAESTGVAQAFHWLGFRRDVASLLAQCDLFVQPSVRDAFPTAVLEAMGAGLPVIASRVGGIPEMVDEGITGILVPPGDADALGRAVVEALCDSPWMDRAGSAGADRVRRDFAIEVWRDRLAALYQRVARSGER